MASHLSHSPVTSLLAPHQPSSSHRLHITTLPRRLIKSRAGFPVQSPIDVDSGEADGSAFPQRLLCRDTGRSCRLLLLQVTRRGFLRHKQFFVFPSAKRLSWSYKSFVLILVWSPEVPSGRVINTDPYTFQGFLLEGRHRSIYFPGVPSGRVIDTDPYTFQGFLLEGK